MKRFSWAIGMTILGLIIYECGAFVAADLNVANWTPLGRWSAVTIWALFLFLSAQAEDEHLGSKEGE